MHMHNSSSRQTKSSCPTQIYKLVAIRTVKEKEKKGGIYHDHPCHAVQRPNGSDTKADKVWVEHVLGAGGLKTHNWLVIYIFFASSYMGYMYDMRTDPRDVPSTTTSHHHPAGTASGRKGLCWGDQPNYPAVEKMSVTA